MLDFSQASKLTTKRKQAHETARGRADIPKSLRQKGMIMQEEPALELQLDHNRVFRIALVIDNLVSRDKRAQRPQTLVPFLGVPPKPPAPAFCRSIVLPPRKCLPLTDLDTPVSPTRDARDGEGEEGEPLTPRLPQEQIQATPLNA
eukprot:g57522.t1